MSYYIKSFTPNMTLYLCNDSRVKTINAHIFLLIVTRFQLLEFYLILEFVSKNETTVDEEGGRDVYDQIDQLTDRVTD